MNPAPRHDLTRTGRATLLWAALFFVAGQLGLSLAMHHLRPALRDPEYGRRLDVLRRRLADQPDKPLVVALGSSRVAVGLRPDLLVEAAAPQAPLVVNYSLLGAGPVMQLLCLRRLLDDGIRPDCLLVEVWAPFLHPDMGKEVKRILATRLDWRDVELLVRYGGDRDELRREWWCSRLAPWFAQRINLMSQVLPGWLPGPSRQNDGYRVLDEWGWVPSPRMASASNYRRGLPEIKKKTGPLVERFQVSDDADRALHEITALCRQHGIALAFLLMPEASDIRGWYALETLARLEQYLARLDGAAVLIDARDWSDDDDFHDGTHLHVSGATSFTERFGREALPRLTR